MDITQLEKAINEKARDRAEKRVKAFCQAFDEAWRILTGRSHTFCFECTDPDGERGKKERAEFMRVIEAVAVSQGGCYRCDPTKYTGWPDNVYTEERQRVIDEILRATEAVRELADLRGEES